MSPALPYRARPMAGREALEGRISIVVVVEGAPCQSVSIDLKQMNERQETTEMPDVNRWKHQRCLPEGGQIK